MSLLAQVGGPIAKQLLSDVAAGQIKPRPLPKADATESEWEKPSWAEEWSESPAGDAEYAKRMLESHAANMPLIAA